jgi:hypothetical protein
LDVHVRYIYETGHHNAFGEKAKRIDEGRELYRSIIVGTGPGGWRKSL